MKNSTKTLIAVLSSITFFILAAWGYVYYFVPERSSIDSPEQQAKHIEVLNQFNSNDLDGAIKNAQALVAKDPSQSSVTGLLQLANAYAQKAGFSLSPSDQKVFAEKAIDYARQVMLIDSQNEEAYRVTGYSYEVMQDYANAEKNYAKALEINPKFDLALSNRGHMYELMGDRAKAFADYNLAYSLNTNGDFTQLNLGRYYFASGEYDQAVLLARGAATSSQNIRIKATAHELLGNIYFSLGSTSKALLEFNASISTDASYADPYFDRAFLAMSLADEKGLGATSTLSVRADIDQGLTLNPAKAFGYFLIGMLYYSDDKAKAKENFEKALGMVDADATVIGANKDVLRQDIQDQLADVSKK